MALAARWIPRAVFAVAVFFSVVAARVAQQGVLDALGLRERYPCHGGEGTPHIPTLMRTLTWFIGVGNRGDWIFDNNGNYRCCAEYVKNPPFALPAIATPVTDKS